MKVTRGSSHPPPPGPQLVVGFGLEGDAESLDACRIARSIEPHSRDADARVVAAADKPGEQVELTIRATNGSRVEDALDLVGVARLRLHDRPQAVQLEACRGGHRCGHRSGPRQAMIASVTRLVSSGLFTGIETTPASSAG